MSVGTLSPCSLLWLAGLCSVIVGGESDAWVVTRTSAPLLPATASLPSSPVLLQAHSPPWTTLECVQTFPGAPQSQAKLRTSHIWRAGLERQAGQTLFSQPIRVFPSLLWLSCNEQLPYLLRELGGTRMGRQSGGRGNEDPSFIKGFASVKTNNKSRDQEHRATGRSFPQSLG